MEQQAKQAASGSQEVILAQRMQTMTSVFANARNCQVEVTDSLFVFVLLFSFQSEKYIGGLH